MTLVDEEIPLNKFWVLVGDVADQMEVVRDAVLAGPAAIEVKPEDGSLVTPDDENVEKGLRRSAKRFGIEFRGEELGMVKATRNSRYIFIVDPIDGTRTRANCDLGGSAVIAYIYDTVLKRIVFSIIGRPGTGEMVVAYDGETDLYLYDYDTRKVVPQRECKVWTRDPKVTRPTVYVDNPNPFTRRGVDMLRADGLDQLDRSFRQLGLTKFAIGSNGLHHMLVALGGAVVGAITTSIGGIQDLGGILVVENAGGVVRAFRLDAERTLVEVDPHADLLMDGGYDFVVMAIDAEHCRQLVDMLAWAV